MPGRPSGSRANPAGSRRRADPCWEPGINSISGLEPAPGLVAYGTSKWTIRGFARTAAKELARDNISCQRHLPWHRREPLAYDPTTGEQLVNVDDQALSRYADVNEITNYVLLAASEDSSYATGTELVVDGGFTLGRLTSAWAARRSAFLPRLSRRVGRKELRADSHR